MAVAETYTLLPLDRVATVLGMSPLHFNGVTSQYHHLDADCDDVWFQTAYQRAEKFSREELARVLAQAEETIAKYLGYWPVPRWIKAEEHQLPQHYRTETYSFFNARGMRKAISARWGYVISGGVRNIDPIELSADIEYLDTDLDGYYETARVIVATDITDVEEIHVFYPGEDAAVEWEIRPVDVSVSGVAATITFRREQAVLPDLLRRMPPPDDPLSAVDGDDDDNFLTVVDVYRVYNDTSQQVLFYYEPSVCAGCSSTTVAGCVVVRDARRGTLAYETATYDEESATWSYTAPCAPSLRAEFWYYAGLQNLESDYPTLRMRPELERLLIYYALSLADKAICGCDNFASHLAYQLEDLAVLGAERRFQTTFKQLDCPLGTSRAALNMWQYIQQHKLGGSLRKGG